MSDHWMDDPDHDHATETAPAAPRPKRARQAVLTLSLMGTAALTGAMVGHALQSDDAAANQDSDATPATSQSPQASTNDPSAGQSGAAPGVRPGPGTFDPNSNGNSFNPMPGGTSSHGS